MHPGEHGARMHVAAESTGFTRALGGQLHSRGRRRGGSVGQEISAAFPATIVTSSRSIDRKPSWALATIFEPSVRVIRT